MVRRAVLSSASPLAAWCRSLAFGPLSAVRSEVACLRESSACSCWHSRPSVGAGCSIKKLAINGLADTLAASGDSFASDEDPDLIRDAVPFSLKTIESLLVEVPEHKGLLLTACGGFTQYAYAFVQTDAELIEVKDYEASVAGRERALKMYQRALGYCLRRVELTHKGFRSAVEKDPDGTMKAFSKDEVPVLYWTGATWGAAVSAGSEKPELLNQLPIVRAIMARALELDEAYELGGIHDVLISLDSLPEAMGGSVKNARQHFARSVELVEGAVGEPLRVARRGISVAEQNRKEFEDAARTGPGHRRQSGAAAAVVERHLSTEGPRASGPRG